MAEQPRPLETDYMMIVDTETYIQNGRSYVFDFGAVIINLNTGNIIPGGELAVLLPPPGVDFELFYNPNEKDSESFWHKDNISKRRNDYQNLYDRGLRSIARPELVNIWVRDHIASNTHPRPIIAAYNFPFDREVCIRSGIRSIVEGPMAWDDSETSGFCLLERSRRVMGKFGRFEKENEKFVTQNSYRTPTGRPSMKADHIAKFIGVRNNHYIDEPHEALSDAKHFEAPIATFLRKHKQL